MNRTAWIVIGALCIIGLGGLIYMTKKDTVNVDTLNPTTIIESTEAAIGDHVDGNKAAKVVVFEYADFQCPGCNAAHTNVAMIKKLYKDKVAFVFRNYPLTSIHPNAMAAAAVAEAAGLQDRYWDMNNLLFENRDSWVDLSAENRGAVFEAYAEQLGLDIDKYRTDLSSEKIQTKIQLDRAIGVKLNVTATPSFFVGSEKVSSDAVNDVIQQQGTLLMDVLDQKLKDAGETPPARS